MTVLVGNDRVLHRWSFTKNPKSVGVQLSKSRFAAFHQNCFVVSPGEIGSLDSVLPKHEAYQYFPGPLIFPKKLRGITCALTILPQCANTRDMFRPCPAISHSGNRSQIFRLSAHFSASGNFAVPPNGGHGLLSTLFGRSLAASYRLFVSCCWESGGRSRRWRPGNQRTAVGSQKRRLPRGGSWFPNKAHQSLGQLELDEAASDLAVDGLAEGASHPSGPAFAKATAWQAEVRDR